MSLDQRIEDKIDALVAEEHAAQSVASSHGLNSEQRAREPGIKVELDRLGDWLRQRRALRAAGRDPNEAHERDPSVVERYLQ